MTNKDSVVERFRSSMVIDHEKWHDGIGYEVDLLPSASDEDRAAIESLLLANGVRDWRDVEALAVLDSPGSQAALRATLESRDPALSQAVTRFAPHLLGDDEKVATLVSVIENGSFGGGGLTQALLQVESLHPPPVIDALLRGVLKGDGSTATHFAAMLYYVHGLSAEAFDWDHRPFFLTFNTDDRGERETQFRELCTRLKVDAGRFLP